ncbi:ABC transporter ATP-binding protein [Nocardioides sp. zg-DK7169]|uniref:ABC transporter ATP-binding protein n=1 Tax=Nocardioides sp. zg-DK7169 TaxID=2736600 RepID=UPI001557B4A9|nr:ABC transporter ATP-binding protein [Nocardioides sp. zg-DK7169]NPC97215.1 ABC transporter ATP-binding protein [Nocardioides sp. zg-DK7169]
MTTTSRTTDDSPAVRLRGLRRTYGTGESAFEAVRGVDLDVARGSVVALLGTNGAGKTSLLEVVEGLAPASAGSVEVLGLDPVADRAKVRRRTGVLLQRSGFAADLTVRETLELWAATLSNPRPVSDGLAMLDLAGRADTRVGALSGGEQRRLDLSCTLLGDPELVLLDEPSTGLDPESRQRLWDLVRELRDAGRTVVLCTHHLEEAEALADRIAIMHGGRIVRDGTAAQITAERPSRVQFATPVSAEPLPAPEALGARHVHAEHGTTTVETDDLQVTLGALLGWATRHGVRLERLDARTASLESVFLDIARHPADDDPRTGPRPGDRALEGTAR